MHLCNLSGWDTPSRSLAPALFSSAAAGGATGPSLLAVSTGA